jgi:hypothetical protein
MYRAKIETQTCISSLRKGFFIYTKEKMFLLDYFSIVFGLSSFFMCWLHSNMVQGKGDLQQNTRWIKVDAYLSSI